MSAPTPFRITKTVRERFGVLAPLVAAPKKVLDLGCVDSRRARHSPEERFQYKANLLHRKIFQANPSVIGVDIDEDGARVLREQGYNVVVADVETADFTGGPFDTIVAGEIIEHLENPGKFLRNMRRHLRDGGVIVVSTPNPFYAASAWKIWRYGAPSVHEEHMGWQDPATLSQLFRRTGFEPIDGYWIQPPANPLKIWKRFLRPYFSHTFMLIARKTP